MYPLKNNGTKTAFECRLLGTSSPLSNAFVFSRMEDYYDSIGMDIGLHPFCMLYIRFPPSSVAVRAAAASFLHLVCHHLPPFVTLFSFLLSPPPCQRVVCATCWWRQPRHTSSVTLVTVREVHVPWTEAGNPSCLTSCFYLRLTSFRPTLAKLATFGFGTVVGSYSPAGRHVPHCSTMLPHVVSSVHTYPCFLRLPHFCITLVAYIAATPCFLTLHHVESCRTTRVVSHLMALHYNGKRTNRVQGQYATM